MSELAQSVEKAYEKAKELNLDVVVPDEYTLQLDIDSPTYPSNWSETFPIVITNFKVQEHWFTTSKSGNLHIYIRVKNPLSAAEKIALQAALGSDPKREILSLARLKRGETTPTLLFEVKIPSSTTATGSEEDEDVVF